MTSSASPVVQVQIVTYNSERWVDGCLRAVLAQRVQPHRILVIDNGSSDQTCARVGRYPQVELVRNQENRGFSAAHNQGIRNSQADFILVLNPDVFLNPQYLERVLAAMADPMVGAVQGKLLRMGEEGEPTSVLDSTGVVMRRDRRAADRGAGETDRGQYDRSGPVFAVTAAAALYRRAMLEALRFEDEYFDEDFYMYKEDVDLSWRARLAGWSCHYEAGAAAHHYRGWREGSRLTQPKYLRIIGLRNRYLLILKNDRVASCLRHLPWLLLTEMGILGYSLLRDPVLFRAWRGVWRLQSRMGAKRRALAARCRLHDVEGWFV